MRTLVSMLLVSAFASTAGAWGLHKAFVGPDYRHLYLVQPILEKRPLRFCLEVDSRTGHRDSSIEAQIRLVLTQYRKVLNEGRGESTFERVDCGSAAYELKVTVGRDRATNNLGYGVPMIERNERGYYFVMLNTHAPKGPAGEPPLLDTLSLFGYDISKLAQAIGPIGNLRTSDPGNFATRHGIGIYALSSSTWSLLLHEIGHGFGLVDNYSQTLFEEQGDERYRTQPYTLGVMSAQGYTNLGPDEVQGLKAAKRMLKELPLPPR